MARVSTVLILRRPEVGGAMMASTRMARVSIVGPPRPAVGVGMPGKVMERLRDPFLDLQVDSSRAPLARIAVREGVSEDIVVVAVVGTVTASLHRLLWWIRRHPRRSMLLVRRRSYLGRLWKW